MICAAVKYSQILVKAEVWINLRQTRKLIAFVLLEWRSKREMQINNVHSIMMQRLTAPAALVKGFFDWQK